MEQSDHSLSLYGTAWNLATSGKNCATDHLCDRSTFMGESCFDTRMGLEMQAILLTASATPVVFPGKKKTHGL
jgi:hypothetical protein